MRKRPLFPALHGATFSECGRYRYLLWRQWDTWSGEPRTCMWLMLNPSTADALENDPTVERCRRRSVEMGFGRMVVCNLFALRSTDPDRLREVDDPVGPDNDAHLRREASEADRVVCAWGHHGAYMARGREVKEALTSSGNTLYCLGTTSAGQPRHPLYVSYQQEPRIWRKANER